MESKRSQRASERQANLESQRIDKEIREKEAEFELLKLQMGIQSDGEDDAEIISGNSEEETAD